MTEDKYTNLSTKMDTTLREYMEAEEVEKMEAEAELAEFQFELTARLTNDRLVKFSCRGSV